MALVAWYKLDGDLKDYSGNNNHLSYKNNNGNLSESSGKIGKSFERAAFEDGPDYFISDRKVDLTGSFTMCCWAYVSESGTSANGLVTNHNHSLNQGSGITVRRISDSDYRISCNTGDGTSRTYYSYYGTSNIKDRWSHLIVRFDKPTNNLSLWVDGEKEYESTYNMKAEEDYISLFSWSLGNLGSNRYRTKAKIDDVRIYDHTLSEKEIKELSKAKIFHCTFDQFEEPTLNYAQYPIHAFKSYYNYSREGDLHTVYRHENSDSRTVALACDHFTREIKPGEAYTISGYLYFNGSPFETTVPDISTYHPTTINRITRKDGYFEFTQTFGESKWIIHSNLCDANPGDLITIRDLQIERKPYSTPFTSDERKGSLIDTSRYHPRTSIHLERSPRWIDSQARVGRGAYDFNGSSDGSKTSYLENDAFIIKEYEAFTYSLWINPRDIGRSQYLIGQSRGNNSDASLMLRNNGVFCFHEHSTEGADRYIAVSPEGTILKDQWQHLAVTYENGEVKTYHNGKMIRSEYYLLDDRKEPFIIGGPTNNTLNRGYNGLMDDIRVYATALSDQKIRELYQIRGSLDNQGNLHIDYFKEYHNWNSEIKNYNLVENGDQEYENNYNFSDFFYDPELRCFYREGGRITILTTEKIPLRGNGVDSWEQYRLEGEIKGLNASSKYYFMLVCYNKYGNIIGNSEVNPMPGTATVLAQDLNPGDEWVFLEDTSNWYDDGSFEYNHRKSLALWHPEDDPLYAPYHYSRRVYRVVEVDKENSRLRLESPYSKETIPAGSPAQNHQSGGTYSYIAASNIWTNLDEWEFKSGTTSTTPNPNNIRYGTTHVRVGLMINRDAVEGTPTTLVRNIRLYNIDSFQKTKMKNHTLGINEQGVLKSPGFSEIGDTQKIKTWFPFEKDFKDLSGNKYSLNISEENTSWVDGLRSQGIRVDDQDNRYKIVLPTTSSGENSFNSGPMTVTTWFRPETLQNSYILCRYSWRIRMESGGRVTFSVGRLDPGDGSQHQENGISITTTSTNIVEANKWAHVSAVYSPGYPNGDGYISIYLNGKLEGTREIGNRQIGRNYGPDNGISWGTTRHGTWTPAAYSYNDTRIYERVLNEEEIGSLYDITNPEGPKMKIMSNQILLHGQIKEV